jgi:hypothetical protein
VILLLAIVGTAVVTATIASVVLSHRVDARARRLVSERRYSLLGE